MHSNLVVTAGIISALINTIGTVPYVIDIFRHKTKPERAMWWIYMVLFGLLFAAQANAKAGWLLVVTATYVFDAALIAVLSLKYGYGKLHRRDAWSLLIAAAGLVAWKVLHQPLAAILMVIVVDAAGFWLTLVKTWHAPHSETLIAWQLSLVGAIVSLFSVSKWTLDIAIYPVYAVLGTGFIVWLIMYRRTKIKEDPPDF
jgi:hypothetical protein